MSMYVYCINPIDNWFGWTQIRRENFGSGLYGDGEVRRKLERAFRLSKSLPDGNDILGQGPYFCPLPNRGDQHFLLGWKMDTNGTTFIASPHGLPWLEDGDNFVIEE